MGTTVRQDQGNVTLTVDGREIPIVFKKRDGGEVDSQESKSYPGGMAGEHAHGGAQTVGNVTLGFEFRPSVHDPIIRFLKSRVGKGECVCVEQPLDVDGNAFGRPQTWKGKLKKTHSGDYDANSSDPRDGELEISTHGEIV